MDLKKVNAARKRFDTMLLKDIRDNGIYGCGYFAKDGALWITNGYMAMHYLQLDYLLDISRFKQVPHIQELLNKIHETGKTETAYLLRKVPNGDKWLNVLTDGIKEVQAQEQYYNIFGDKFEYCIKSSATVAVYSGNDLIGFILPVKEKSEEDGQ